MEMKPHTSSSVLEAIAKVPSVRPPCGQAPQAGVLGDLLKGMNFPQEFFIFHLHADASILLSTRMHIRGQLKDDLIINATQF